MRWDYEKGYREGQKEAIQTVLKIIENDNSKEDLNEIKRNVEFLMGVYDNIHSMYSKDSPFR